jgi:hypothetical protein
VFGGSCPVAPRCRRPRGRQRNPTVRRCESRQATVVRGRHRGCPYPLSRPRLCRTRRGLTVRPPVCDATQIHIELTPGQFLQLQSIGLDGSSATALTDSATVRASSWYGNYENSFDPARLFDLEHPTGTVVHTEADEPAWLEIDLPEPVQLAAVRLRNVTGPPSARARGIRVLARGRDGAGRCSMTRRRAHSIRGRYRVPDQACSGERRRRPAAAAARADAGDRRRLPDEPKVLRGALLRAGARAAGVQGRDHARPAGRP